MAKKENTSFEEQLKRLEQIVDLLDRSEAPLEDMIKSYEEGMKLVKSMREFLNNAEQKVIDITKGFNSGKLPDDSGEPTIF